MSSRDYDRTEPINMMYERRKVGVMERRIQSIVQAVIMMLLVWVGKTLLEVRDSSIETKASLGEMKSQVAEINGRFAYYLPRAEADARFSAEESKHTDMARRLDSLENRGRQ